MKNRGLTGISTDDLTSVHVIIVALGSVSARDSFPEAATEVPSQVRTVQLGQSCCRFFFRGRVFNTIESNSQFHCKLSYPNWLVCM